MEELGWAFGRLDVILDLQMAAVGSLVKPKGVLGWAVVQEDKLDDVGAVVGFEG